MAKTAVPIKGIHKCECNSTGKNLNKRVRTESCFQVYCPCSRYILQLDTTRD